MCRLLLLLTCLPAWAFAQPAKTVATPEWLLSLARVGEYHVSPDGKTVAYAVTRMSVAENKGEKDLYIAATAGPGAPRVLTAEKGTEASPRFRPDGKAIGYLADKGGVMQVWQMNLTGSEKVCLTNASHDIDGFIWTPTGGLVYTSRVKMDSTEAERYADAPKTQARMIEGLLYRHWNHWGDYSYAHLFYAAPGQPVGIDLMEGQRYDCPVPPMGGMEDVAVTPDGKYVVYACRKERGARKALSTNTDLYKVDLETRKTINITEGNLGYDRIPAVSPDGKLIAWSSMVQAGNEADKPRLMVMEVATGYTKRDLTANFDEGVAGAPIWTPDGKALFVPVHHKGTEQIFYFSLDGKTAPKAVSKGRQNLADVQLAAGGLLVCPRTAMDAPADLVSLNPKDGKQVNLTMTNQKTIDGTALATVQSRTVKTTDGKEMLVWMILPPNFDAAKKYPTLLFCQGGPQSPVSQSFSFRWNFMVLASQGYVVVAPLPAGHARLRPRLERRDQRRLGRPTHARLPERHRRCRHAALCRQG